METEMLSFTRRVAIAGERARISRQRLRPRGVVLRACASNRGRVYVGDHMVTSGDPGLSPGRALAMRGYPRVDLTKVFVDGEFAGDGVEVTILESRARVNGQ